MSATLEADKCVVVRKPCCGRVVFACALEHADDYRKDVGRLARAGCTIEHLTTEEVRKAAFGCFCRKEHGA